jgi:aminomuconate-semialdehyde/2-hydroxymuconate-6-semialdehyde dehydrogenase
MQVAELRRCTATGKIVAHIADSDSADINRAVEAAQAAFPAWSKRKAEERANILYRVGDLIEKRREELATLESEDQGKPVWLAREVDIPRAVKNFRTFAGAILHHEESSMEMDGEALNYTTRTPLGVAGLISPWNLPLYLATWKIAPAIAVGNTCVVKPSELTPSTAFALREILQEAGIPPGVVNIVQGTGARAGATLTAHPHVPLISFTGGTQTAESILKATAPHFKKVGLELGGKNPNIIFDDADLERCIPTTIRSSFLNQGEICLCGSRIFVQKGIYKQFLDRFTEETKKLVVGDPASPKTFMGPLISKSHLEKVEGYIELARKLGGTIACGGTRPNVGGAFAGGFFLSPTIITDLSNDCRVTQEEIFGPVVTVVPFETETEVIAAANGTKYGLSASLWTQNVSRAHRVAQQIDSGYVWVNCWTVRDLRTPFGGMKASGIGREGGRHSVDFYTELKTICVKY